MAKKGGPALSTHPGSRGSAHSAAGGAELKAKDPGKDRTALSLAGNAFLLGKLKNWTQGSGHAGAALSKMGHFSSESQGLVQFILRDCFLVTPVHIISFSKKLKF